MITGTLVVADMAISFTMPGMMNEQGTVTVCEMLGGTTRTTQCTHAQLGAALLLCLAGDDAVSEDIVDNLYAMAEQIQPKTDESQSTRWIP